MKKHKTKYADHDLFTRMELDAMNELAYLRVEVERLRKGIRAALFNLGVPTPEYPAPVAYAVDNLHAALGENQCITK